METNNLIKWRNPTTHTEIPNALLYLADMMVNYNGTIHIGCDSIVAGKYVWYVVVIAFRHEGKRGAHFIYKKIKVDREFNGRKPDKQTIFNRLFYEGRLTIEIAEQIIESNVLSFKREDLRLEFDYNNMTETLSTPLINAVVGWSTGVGFTNSILKSGEQIACKAANQICQGC